MGNLSCICVIGTYLSHVLISTIMHKYKLIQVNYQYRNGTSFPVSLKTLYADGGIPRFYRGVLPALIQGPMSRFGDTAANQGMMTLMDSMDATKDLNVGFKTVSASMAAAVFRIFLMPVVSNHCMGIFLLPEAMLILN